MLNDYDIYEILKQMYPKDTKLKKNILEIIDGVDPNFRKRHSDFFYTKDPMVDCYTNDGIIDWLYGYRYTMNSNMTNEEIKIFNKIIQKIERNKI